MDVKDYIEALEREKAGYDAADKPDRAKACAAEIARVTKDGAITPAPADVDDRPRSRRAKAAAADSPETTTSS